MQVEDTQVQNENKATTENKTETASNIPQFAPCDLHSTFPIYRDFMKGSELTDEEFDIFINELKTYQSYNKETKHNLQKFLAELQPSKIPPKIKMEKVTEKPQAYSHEVDAWNNIDFSNLSGDIELSDLDMEKILSDDESIETINNIYIPSNRITNLKGKSRTTKDSAVKTESDISEREYSFSNSDKGENDTDDMSDFSDGSENNTSQAETGEEIYSLVEDISPEIKHSSRLSHNYSIEKIPSRVYRRTRVEDSEETELRFCPKRISSFGSKFVKKFKYDNEREEGEIDSDDTDDTENDEKDTIIKEEPISLADDNSLPVNDPHQLNQNKKQQSHSKVPHMENCILEALFGKDSLEAICDIPSDSESSDDSSQDDSDSDINPESEYYEGKLFLKFAKSYYGQIKDKHIDVIEGAILGDGAFLQTDERYDEECINKIRKKYNMPNEFQRDLTSSNASRIDRSKYVLGPLTQRLVNGFLGNTKNSDTEETTSPETSNIQKSICAHAEFIKSLNINPVILEKEIKLKLQQLGILTSDDDDDDKKDKFEDLIDQLSEEQTNLRKIIAHNFPLKKALLKLMKDEKNIHETWKMMENTDSRIRELLKNTSEKDFSSEETKLATSLLKTREILVQRLEFLETLHNEKNGLCSLL